MALEGLDRVPWAELEDAYGPATRVPEFIRQLRSADAEERKQALDGLWNTIFHQGTRYPAAPPAVPFLLELLADPTTSDRPALVRLLILLAVGYPENHLPLGFDPAAAFAAADDDAVDAGEADWDAEDATWARRSYRAVLRGADLFRTLAQGDDPQLRAAAIRALAWLPDEAAGSLPVVRQVVEAATDPEEKADAVLSLGLLARAAGEDADLERLRQLLAPESARVVRIASAISLAVARKDSLPDRALNLLLEAVQELPAGEGAAAGGFGWHYNGMIAHVSDTLAYVAPSPEERVVNALCRAAEVTPPMASLNVIGTLLAIVFPTPEPAEFVPDVAAANGVRVVFGDPARLDECQRRAVSAILRSPLWAWKGDAFDAHSELLWSFGLPARPEELAAYGS